MLEVVSRRAGSSTACMRAHTLPGVLQATNLYVVHTHHSAQAAGDVSSCTIWKQLRSRAVVPHALLCRWADVAALTLLAAYSCLQMQRL